jgi:hypothetical protein
MNWLGMQKNTSEGTLHLLCRYVFSPTANVCTIFTLGCMAMMFGGREGRNLPKALKKRKHWKAHIGGV